MSVLPNGTAIGTSECYPGLQADISTFRDRENWHRFSTGKEDIDAGAFSHDGELKRMISSKLGNIGC